MLSMNTFVLSLLSFGGGTGSVDPSLMMIPLIIAIFYFLIIRPQSKKRKETEKMLAALKKGDRVVTIGGIHGTITTVRESTVILKVDESVKLEFLRSAIASVTTAAKEKIEDKEDSEGDSGE
jgi:preprotein translocase subunit YajC